jgi:predicted amidophosphoribosyltransferase
VPVCYKVIEYEYRPKDAPPVLRVVCTTSPPATSIREVIRSTFSSVDLPEPSQGLLWMLSNEEEIVLGGILPPRDEMERLLMLMGKVLTVRDTCNISHCLDFYRNPVETAKTPEEWPYTPTGRSLYRAKYRDVDSEGSRLQRELVAFAREHPALARSDAVAAIPPSSEHGNRPDWPAVWARGVADTLGARVVALRRTRPTRLQKGIEDRDERARNQRGSMAADQSVAGDTVLVVDDLYMQGDSMHEAVRALREAGAAAVFGLCVAKTVKGCQGYPF